jgi:hypothetical protein
MNLCLICTKPTKFTYCSLSCSNAGRVPKNAAKYALNPKHCLFCRKALPYGKRLTNSFCDHSCAATMTNAKRQKILKPKRESRESIHQQTLRRFELGQVSWRDTLRKLLIEIKGNKCSKCGLPPVWCGEPLTLSVDHEDGNAGNNLPSNVRLLCPNCNSQTPTFGGRNKGHGRKARGLPR